MSSVACEHLFSSYWEAEGKASLDGFTWAPLFGQVEAGRKGSLRSSAIATSTGAVSWKLGEEPVPLHLLLASMKPRECCFHGGHADLA